jgi:hypothetical protein
MYTDPSGEEFTLLAAVLIGAAVSAFTYTMTALLADVPFSVGGLLKATFIGAASAAVTFGIGTGAENLFTTFSSKAAFQAVAHGTFQGGMTAISGGKFWSGFAAGALSSIASSAWGGGTSQTEGFSAENNWAYGAKTIHHAGLGAGTGTAGMIAFGTVAGGAGAALTGGNFWQGAVTGLVVSGLNHAMHKMGDFDSEGEGEDPPKYKYKDKFYEDKAKLYGDILLDQAAEQFGIKDVLALGAGLSGYNIIPTRGKFEGAIKGTSLNSKLSRNITLSVEKASFGMLKKLPTLTGGPFTGAPLRKMMVNTIGKFLGRTLGPIGWGMLAYDVGMTFYNTQQIYNSITNGK